MPSKVWGEITYPFPNFNGAAVEVWEWMSNFILLFLMDVITHPCSGYICTMLVKWATLVHTHLSTMPDVTTHHKSNAEQTSVVIWQYKKALNLHRESNTSVMIFYIWIV